MQQLNISLFKKFSILLTALCFSASIILNAQDSKGTDFWLTFPGNYTGSTTLSFFISGDQNTTGTVAIPGVGFSAPFTVTAGAVTTVVLPASAQINASNTITSNGVHVTAAKEVTVYGLSRQQFTTDAYLGLPTDILGTSYIVLGYKNSNVVNGTQFAVVATQNATTVTITPTLATDGHAANTPYTITLNQGETYQLRNTDFAPSDLSGSIVMSNKPIAVFGGHQCANIPPGSVACDYVVEQLPPTTTWGKNFVTVPLKTRTGGDTFRFLASTNSTTVRVNGAVVATLNRGQLWEQIITGSSQITSNQPILVSQYSNSSSFDGVTSDPFMMLIPPFEQYLGNYTISTPASGFSKNFVNIVVPNAAVGTIKLDGVLLPASAFTAIGSTGFSGAQVDLTLGAHTINGTNLPFGVFVYGFDSFDSYGYPGGESLAPIANITSITLAPKTGTSPINVEKCWDATVKDQFSKAVVGARVDFNITGPNSSKSGFAITDATGKAHFCYTGTATGTDKIVASVGTLSDDGSFIWTATTGNIYYSKATGDLHNVLTWGLNPDGSGANPPNFGSGKTFQLANRVATYTMTDDWTVGGIINIPTGSALNLNGHTLSEAQLEGAGSLTGSTTSSLIVTGTTGGDAGALRFTSGAGGSLKNLTLNRTGTGASATIASALAVYGVLDIKSGQLKTGNLLTLKSNAANTARVAAVTGTITGNVTVERYIPARRAWRLMGAPVGGSQSIFSAWQEGATTESVNPNPHPGFGTHITGGPTGTVANGFDLHKGSAVSIKSYNSATDAWVGLGNTNATAVGSKAFMLFVRGNRSLVLDGTTATASNTVLRATGTLKTGNQTFNVGATGFTAIANPFASPINYATITRTNVQNNFYLWDPKMGGTYGVGAFVNVSFNGTGYDVTPASVSPESQYIQSGQAFLVHSTGVAGSIVIKESDKSATPATNVFEARTDRQANETGSSSSSTQGLRVNLQTAIAANNVSVLDEVFTSYGSQFSKDIDNMDAVKVDNVGENLAIMHDKQSLMVERRPINPDNDVINLRLYNTSNASYVFEFNPINMSSTGLYATLVDKYLNTSTPISLDKVSQVYFEVNNENASSNSERFKVILSTKRPDQLITGVKNRITAFPNPVVGNSINLQFENADKGTYRVELVNSIGQVILRKDIDHTGGSAIQRIPLNKQLSKGVYQMQLTGKSVNTTLKLFSN